MLQISVRQKVEIVEAPVALRPMSEGREVVEDYGHVGLSLRRHPVSFLREALCARRIVTCAEAAAARDGRACKVAGLVLVRQKPGSAKGVMFITIEDETGVANLVIWPSLFARQRRLILSAGMIAVDGRVQREGEVVHLVAYRLIDLSADLRAVGERAANLHIARGRGDGATHPAGPDPRDPTERVPRVRDIYPPEFPHGGIRVATRDFR